MNEDNRKIKSIEIVLENSEIIKIEAVNIALLNLCDITRSLFITTNQVHESIKANKIFMKLNPKANKWTEEIKPKQLPFGREQQYNDIAALDLQYTDGTSEYIYM